MATERSTSPDRLALEQIDSTIGSVKKLLLVGGLFAAVGSLLIIGALVLEVTQVHPMLEDVFATHTRWSLAGGGADRAGQAGLNAQLAEIHTFPSTLRRLKLGGIGHVLVGIFISLVAIVRVLGMMPHRLSYEMQRAQE